MFREAGLSMNPNATSRTTVTIGYMIASSNNADLETALNPAWRDSVSHFVLVSGWPAGAPDDVVRAVRDDTTFNKTRYLRDLDPDSGAYFKETLLSKTGNSPPLAGIIPG
ncbi:hypothetical protein SODALDRAFT_326816 [Sodiomyces alkalinus F11]|uniref:Berberine/berberine-like domain-containing protein n=1 Tax=Sodiomyces alkalinus (strain CBS 110278 / VKM F-3762 / F11) TaxID=1314773 RepID=A0A3N2Q7J8_SODAK|nr:hypothetical protein SODALDRAFT_326816 [Sodiomyces alkalinus F11]ROT42657.1 hypothetical protein SODALDRAFT_326816 [Sodiomyces alkalinus F11]